MNSWLGLFPNKELKIKARGNIRRSIRVALTFQILEKALKLIIIVEKQQRCVF